MEGTRRKPSAAFPRWAWYPPSLLAAATLGGLALDPQAVFQPPYLLPAVNLVFLTGVSVLVAVWAARCYLGGGSSSVVLMGSAMLLLGVSSFVGSLLSGLPDPNDGIALHNLALVLVGLGHVVSAVPTGVRQAVDSRSARLRVLGSYGAVLAVAAAMLAAIRAGWVPRFFVQGEGSTPIRDTVLSAAIVLFAVAALRWWQLYQRGRLPFLAWYALGLALIAIGLVGIAFQTAIGTALNWAGRSSQYVGGVYLLAAVLSAVRQAGGWRLPLEQALAESETRYQGLVELSPDAILVHADGTCLFANAAAACLLDADSPAELVGRTVLELLDPAEHDVVCARIREVEAGRVTTLRETTVVRLDGERVPVEVTGAPVTFEGRSAVQIVMHDMTNRKRTEVVLRGALQRLDAHMANSPLAVVEFDPAFRITRWSAEAERLFGWPAAEVLGKAIAELRWVHEEDAARVQNLSAEMLAGRGQRNAHVNRNYRKDGTIVHCKWYNSALYDADGRLTSILSLGLDITEQTRAEEGLAAERRLLAAVLEQAPDPMMAVNTEERYILANSAARKHLRQDPVGKRINEVMEPLGTLLDGRGRPIPYGRRPLQRALRGDRVRGQHQILVRADGQRSEHLCSATPIVLGDLPEERIALGIIIDITAEKATAEALRAALAEKEEALATNLTLLREVHHRVKNNLQMLCDMIYLQLEAMPDRDQHPDLQDAYGRIYAVARLHEQLYQTMQSGRVDLRQYLGRLVEGVCAVYPHAAVRVQAIEGITLDLDRAIHIGLLVNELVTNALKHAFPPGRTGEIEVALRLTGEQLELQVRDNGVGVPADLDLETVKSLGLRIVRILAKRLQATVSVETADGTAFLVRFPLHGEPPVEPA